MDSEQAIEISRLLEKRELLMGFQTDINAQFRVELDFNVSPLNDGEIEQIKVAARNAAIIFVGGLIKAINEQLGGMGLKTIKGRKLEDGHETLV